MSHIPVLLEESLELLRVSCGDRIIDATFGGGGHTKAILSMNLTCHVTAIDRDPDAIERAKIIQAIFNERFTFKNMKFSEISTLAKNGSEKYDAVLFDFGLSSFQIDSPERGFSFMNSAKLDMRMSGSNEGDESAMDVINNYSQEDLADIIYNYGEELKAKKIARNIVQHRQNQIIETTSQLHSIVNEVFNEKKPRKIDNATKTFQAIRIYVNDELREISTALEALPKVLKQGARIVTISFHALEDRIIKVWQKNNSEFIKCINHKVIRPTSEEIKSNIRSRSAILRGFTYE